MRKLSTDLIKSGSFTGSFSGSVIGTITSASFASTASYLLNSFSLTTGSTYPITSSWSNKSITSSYSITSSNLSPVAQDLVPISNSLYSLGSPTNKWKDLYVSTGSIYIGDTVLSTSGSTLYTNTSPVVTLNTASGQIEISGISASLSASYATNAGLLNNTSSTIFATTGSNNFNGNQTVQGNITIVGSLTAQQYVVSSSVSYFTSSNFDGSTKFGDTDSDTHQFTGSLRSPNITGSLLGTSSFSNNSTSASYSSTASVALNALTSSYINVATNAVSSSFASTASISVSSSFATTSSYNLNSISSSYSLTASFAANAGSSLSTGSTYPITSSWATTSSNIIGGTSNYIPLWSTNTSLGNSVLYQSSSNIGIGTTSPGYKLDVVGAVRSNIDNSFSFALNRSAITVWNGLGFLTNNVSKWFVGLRETNDDNLRWYNYTNSTERMVLTETGNLGIGTSSPTSILHISSTGGISSPILRISGSATNTYNWASATIYSNLTSSATAIHLIGKSETIYNSAYFGYKHSADNSVNNAISFGFFAANDLVNILANGNLGIGTTSPVTKLQVNGNISGSSFTGSVFGTSSWATNASTASYVVNSISSSYALTASYALNAGSGGGSTTTSSLIGQTFVPTASVSQLSLTQSVSNNDQILVILDGLVQSRTGSYTVSGSTLTLTENADSGSNIDVRFLGGSSSGGSSVSSSYALTSSFSSTSAPRTAIYRYGTTSIVNPGGYADTIIKYDTAVIDTTSWYNNSNGRFTPDVAGWYMVCGSARVYGGSSTAEGYLGLFKNGARIVSNGGLGFVQGSISFLVYFNGSTDYVQFYSNTSTAITNGAASTTTSFTMVYMTS